MFKYFNLLNYNACTYSKLIHSTNMKQNDTKHNLFDEVHPKVLVLSLIRGEQGPYGDVTATAPLINAFFTGQNGHHFADDIFKGIFFKLKGVNFD